MALGLSLVGLDPSVNRRYIWVGDDAVDRDGSDLVKWYETGLGLKADDAQATIFVCKPLSPTVLQVVLRQAAIGLQITASPTSIDTRALSWVGEPATLRAAVSYGVVAIERGPFERQFDIGGLRLTDRLLDALDEREVKIQRNGKAIEVKLLTHLGELILADSEHTDDEGKA